MYRILPLLGDVGLGILIIIGVSMQYGQQEWEVFLLLPLALLPDLDAIPELWKRGKVAASASNPNDHRELLHRPLIWLFVAGILWWSVGFYGAVAFALLLGHFLHDSVLTGWGVPWLSPFSDTRVKFFTDKYNEFSLATGDWVRLYEKLELHLMIVTYGNENWIEDLYLHPTVVSVVEYSVFVTGIIAAILFFY